MTECLTPTIPLPPTPIDPPSFLHQTPWRTDYFAFPYEPAVRHFNPSIVDFNGRLIFCSRRSYGEPRPIGQNSLTLWSLSKTLSLTDPQPLRFIKSHAGEQWEDPRLVILNHILFVSLTNFKVQDYKAHQLLARVSFPFCEAAHICYGKNSTGLTANLGNEKNWAWFDHKNGWHFIYHPWPHHVVRTNFGEAGASYVGEDAPCPWEYGEMRGGTPPVLHDGLYWTFFHSSTTDLSLVKKRRYHMGAYAFDPEPPFTIRLMTLEPLLSGSIKDGGLLPCIFPGGAVFRDAKWLVVFGVNDSRSGFIEIPHDDLVERMTNL